MFLKLIYPGIHIHFLVWFYCIYLRIYKVAIKVDNSSTEDKVGIV